MKERLIRTGVPFPVRLVLQHQGVCPPRVPAACARRVLAGCTSTAMEPVACEVASFSGAGAASAPAGGAFDSRFTPAFVEFLEAARAVRWRRLLSRAVCGPLRRRGIRSASSPASLPMPENPLQSPRATDLCAALLGISLGLLARRICLLICVHPTAPRPGSCPSSNSVELWRKSRLRRVVGAVIRRRSQTFAGPNPRDWVPAR